MAGGAAFWEPKLQPLSDVQNTGANHTGAARCLQRGRCQECPGASLSLYLLSFYNITAVFMTTPHTAPSLLDRGGVTGYVHIAMVMLTALGSAPGGWFQMASSHSHNRPGRRNAGGFAPLDAPALPPGLGCTLLLLETAQSRAAHLTSL